MRVLVTGAASGIGRATCVRLARDAKTAGRAARVAAVDVGPSAQLDGLVAELRELGADALPLHGDMGTRGRAGAGRGRGGRSASAASTGSSATPASTGPGRSSSTRSRTGTGSSP